MRLYEITITFNNNKPPLDLSLLLKDDKELQEYHNKYIYKLDDVMLTETTYINI